MAKVNVENLLGNLLNNLGEGKITADSLGKKKAAAKKSKKLGSEGKVVYQMDKPSMKTVSLVLLTHVYVCNCGAEHKAPNMHVLTKQEDKRGNLHYTQYVSGTDIKEAPREIVEEVIQVNACQDCFADSEWLVPVTNKDAQDSVKPVENNMTFDEISDILNGGSDDDADNLPEM